MFLLLSFCFSANIQGIISKYYNDNIIKAEASGSSKQDINGSLQTTKPEYSIYPWHKDYDWCSNCGHTYSEKPWLLLSFPEKSIKLNGYFVRSGCCEKECCCEEAGYYCVQCCLYSWSLQISDDKINWKEIHKIEKDFELRRCKEKTFNLDKEYTAKYVRLIQNEPCPGDPPCVAINKFEIFGEVIGMKDDEFQSFHDDEDDISIIGHISRNNKVDAI